MNRKIFIFIIITLLIICINFIIPLNQYISFQYSGLTIESTSFVVLIASSFITIFMNDSKLKNQIFFSRLNIFNKSKRIRMFISCPMSVIDKAELDLYKNKFNILIEKINNELKIENIYYASKNLVPETFEKPNEAFKSAMDALNNTNYFIILYPKKISTSCLIEVGYALSLSIPIHIYVRDKNDIPYILKDSDKLKGRKILIHKYSNLDDLTEMIFNHLKDKVS